MNKIDCIGLLREHKLSKYTRELVQAGYSDLRALTCLSFHQQKAVLSGMEKPKIKESDIIRIINIARETEEVWADIHQFDKRSLRNSMDGPPPWLERKESRHGASSRSGLLRTGSSRSGMSRSGSSRSGLPRSGSSRSIGGRSSKRSSLRSSREPKSPRSSHKRNGNSESSSKHRSQSHNSRTKYKRSSSSSSSSQRTRSQSRLKHTGSRRASSKRRHHSSGGTKKRHHSHKKSSESLNSTRKKSLKKRTLKKQKSKSKLPVKSKAHRHESSGSSDSDSDNLSSYSPRSPNTKRTRDETVAQETDIEKLNTIIAKIQQKITKAAALQHFEACIKLENEIRLINVQIMSLQKAGAPEKVKIEKWCRDCGTERKIVGSYIGKFCECCGYKYSPTSLQISTAEQNHSRSVSEPNGFDESKESPTHSNGLQTTSGGYRSRLWKSRQRSLQDESGLDLCLSTPLSLPILEDIEVPELEQGPNYDSEESDDSPGNTHVFDRDTSSSKEISGVMSAPVSRATSQVVSPSSSPEVSSNSSPGSTPRNSLKNGRYGRELRESILKSLEEDAKKPKAAMYSFEDMITFGGRVGEESDSDDDDDLKVEEVVKKLGVEDLDLGTKPVINTSTTVDDPRFQIVDELVHTEKSYVANLDVLNNVYISPLKLFAASDPIITNKAITKIFGNIPIILGLNKQFLSDMELRLEQWGPISLIGDLFVKYGYFFKMYTSYVTSHQHGEKELLSQLDNNPQFSHWAATCDQSAMCKGNTLASFLIMPIQRIPRYQLLLDQMVRHTEDTHPDYENLVLALAIIKEVAEKINDSIQQQENRMRIIDIQQKFGGDIMLVEPQRLFVRRGMLTKVCRKSDREFVFFLFTDLLIYSSKMGFKYKLHRMLKIDDSFSLSSLKGKSFVIRSKQKSFVVYARNKKEKEAWIKDLNTCIQLAPKQNSKLSVAPGDVAPVWQPDSAAASCQICNSKFTVFTRRHHCRKCGALVCSDCSRSKEIEKQSNSVKRVCDRCISAYVRISSPQDDIEDHIEERRARKETAFRKARESLTLEELLGGSEVRSPTGPHSKLKKKSLSLKKLRH